MKLSFWSLNVGLILMFILSMLPVGLLQAWASIERGTWYARSAEFMRSGSMQTLRWMAASRRHCVSIGAAAAAFRRHGLCLSDRPTACGHSTRQQAKTHRPGFRVARRAPRTRRGACGALIVTVEITRRLRSRESPFKGSRTTPDDARRESLVRHRLFKICVATGKKTLRRWRSVTCDALSTLDSFFIKVLTSSPVTFERLSASETDTSST